MEHYHSSNGYQIGFVRYGKKMKTDVFFFIFAAGLFLVPFTNLISRPHSIESLMCIFGSTYICICKSG